MRPTRSFACLLRAGLMVGLVACACRAAAQDKPRPRAKPLPEPSDTPASPANSLSDAPNPGAPASATPAPRDAKANGPILRPVIPPPPPLVLRSAVHSRYSQPAVLARSTTGQCRAQCAVSRSQCASGEGDTSGCDPGWTQCLSTCGGLTYSRGP